MPNEIVRLQSTDFEEALDVLNISFGMQHPRDFEKLLPALYQNTQEHMSWNWALREDDRDDRPIEDPGGSEERVII